MAKSLRSKTKRAHRADKRTTGVYGALEAARLNRLNTKLHRAKEGLAQRGTERDERGLWGAVAAGKGLGVAEEEVRVREEEVRGREREGEEERERRERERERREREREGMDIDVEKISTHGRTPARNDEWRASKGMTPRTRKTAVNKQGVVKGARKAGRSHRRR